MPALPALVGTGLTVPLVGGGTAPYVNLDIAASAPALVAVRDAVEEFLPFYSSVHRGAGWKSKISTEVFEVARANVHAFVGARPDDVVVFNGNTTTALNTLAEALPEDCRVVTFSSEHHANLLPWHRRALTVLDTPRSPGEMLGLLAETLQALGSDTPVLVSVTGAGNVTGELWPVTAIGAICREYGARLVVDCAQLAPHAPVTMADWGADWVVLSGHKLYAPYGAGALVGRRDWLEHREPWVRGGGAVRFVTTDGVAWADAPERQEAGSPNVVGAMALGVACAVLQETGMASVAMHDADLEAHASRRLAEIPGIQRYRLWGADHPRIGTMTFNLGDLHHGLVAAVLSAEHGVAVRDGCFCAHPLMLQLLEVPDETADQIRAEVEAGAYVNVPGAVRMSTGLCTTVEDIDRAVEGLQALVDRGPKWRYVMDEATAHFSPDPDDRPRPPLAGLRGVRQSVGA